MGYVIIANGFRKNDILARYYPLLGNTPFLIEEYGTMR